MMSGKEANEEKAITVSLVKMHKVLHVHATDISERRSGTKRGSHR